MLGAGVLMGKIFFGGAPRMLWFVIGSGPRILSPLTGGICFSDLCGKWDFNGFSGPSKPGLVITGSSRCLPFSNWFEPDGSDGLQNPDWPCDNGGLINGLTGPCTLIDSEGLKDCGPSLISLYKSDGLIVGGPLPLASGLGLNVFDEDRLIGPFEFDISEDKGLLEPCESNVFGGSSKSTMFGGGSLRGSIESNTSDGADLFSSRESIVFGGASLRGSSKAKSIDKGLSEPRDWNLFGSDALEES